MNPVESAVIMLFATAFPLAVIHSCTFNHSSVLAINPQQDHYASAPITEPALESWEKKWSVWCEVCVKHKLWPSEAVDVYCLCRAVADMLISLIVS